MTAIRPLRHVRIFSLRLLNRTGAKPPDPVAAISGPGCPLPEGIAYSPSNRDGRRADQWWPTPERQLLPKYAV